MQNLKQRAPRGAVCMRLRHAPGRGILFTLLFLSIGGCSTTSLYFHNQGYEDTTTALKKQVDDLDVSGAFKTLTANAVELSKQEDQAAIASLVSTRNSYLVQLIDPFADDPLGSSKGTAPARLKSLVESDLSQLAPDGEPYLSGAQVLQDLEARGDDAGRTAFLNAMAQGGNPALAIPKAASAYLQSLADQDAAKKEARELKDKVDNALGTMNGTADPTKALSDVIAKLKDAGALAQKVGFTEVEKFLKCGLVADLESASKDLAEDSTAPAKNASGATPAPAAAAAPPADDESTDCTSLKANAADGGDEQNKAIAALAKLFVQAVADGAATDRLKRIDANILTLAELRQRLTLAKSTIDYENSRQLLFRGQIFALLVEYRLLHQSGDALAQLKTDYDKFGSLRNRGPDSDRRSAALALSSYVGAWNYGRIPAALVDFRFNQARRKFEIDVASATAANYKQLVQPIVDALAKYGAGGITPDTLAEVLGNLGIIGVLAK